MEGVREHFNVLNEYIYLDSAATTLTPKTVVDAMSEYYQNYRSNVHRSRHDLSQKATLKYEITRDLVANLIGCGRQEVVFTQNTTHSINTVASSIRWKKGDEVIVPVSEHVANILPWMRLKQQGVELKFVKLSHDKNSVDLNDLDSKITDKTKLIGLSHISHVLGSHLHSNEIRKMCEENGILYLIDAAQSVGHQKVNVKNLGCDFLAFSSHKSLPGPTGLGVLYINKKIEEGLQPVYVGAGSAEIKEGFSLEYSNIPYRFESGTPNIAATIGLAEAIRYVQDIGIKKIEMHVSKLSEELYKKLSDIKDVSLHSINSGNAKSGIVSFTVSKRSHHNIADLLNKEKILVRSGHLNAGPLIDSLGIKGIIRASLHFYNNNEDINMLYDNINRNTKK